jgi:hypothetical protein
MDNLDLINFRAISTLIGKEVRRNKIQKKHQDKIKELDDLIDYWKKRHNL